MYEPPSMGNLSVRISLHLIKVYSWAQHAALSSQNAQSPPGSDYSAQQSLQSHSSLLAHCISRSFRQEGCLIPARVLRKCLLRHEDYKSLGQASLLTVHLTE